MSTSLEFRILQERAKMLAEVRAFFASRGVVEVDTPILSRAAPIATQIEVMQVQLGNDQRGFLHTSPEYAMKRLLAEFPMDMYQMSHVFRQGEVSARHNPEFTMVEWYRMGFDLDDLLKETVEMVELFLDRQELAVYTYRELFLKYAGIDPFEVVARDGWSADTWLDYKMSFEIQPQMKGLMAVRSFPASQAALARLKQEGEHIVAERFELYYDGVELANGFYELTDPVEQRVRFENDLRERKEMGKPDLPIDEEFLRALEKGLPECSGVAMGFDRLLMLRQKAESLSEIMPFTWDS